MRSSIGLLLPYAMEFNRGVRTRELAAVAAALRPEAGTPAADESARAAVAIVAGLCRDIGLPETLAELGVAEDDLRGMAEQASGVTRLVENNPRLLDTEGLLFILRAAWSGDKSRLADLAPSHGAAL